MRVLVLSTPAPDATRPFGRDVERQLRALAALPDTEVAAVAGVAVPPWPLTVLPRYRARVALPAADTSHGIVAHRPRFAAWPAVGTGGVASRLARAAAPVAATFRPDVIHAAGLLPNGPAALALGRRLAVPVSLAASDGDLRHAARTVVRAAAHGADGMIASSNALADALAAAGLPRATVLRAGIDHARFRPVERGAAKRALGVRGPLVVSVGALIPRKGHDVVITAVARLRGVTLLIAGGGPERARLQRLIAMLGVADRVRLIGHVPQRALPRLLAAADAMALASMAEAFAGAWVEALACGTPIVVPAVGDARAVVTAPAAGQIAERTPAAFAAALAELIAAPPPAATVAAAVADISWERNACLLRAHLARLIDGAG